MKAEMENSKKSPVVAAEPDSERTDNAELIDEVLRRAAWDAMHGPIHLRRGHFYLSREAYDAAMARIDKVRQ